MRARFRLTNDRAFYGFDIDLERQAKIEAALVDEVKLRRIPDDYHLEESRGRVEAHAEYEGDVEAVMAALAGTDVHVELVGAASARPIVDLFDEVRRMRERLDSLTGTPDTYINNKVDVHVPGNALLTIDEVQVFNDLCTEELQGLLEDDDGGRARSPWRILAICPQPDQRRPDYVLGRRRGEGQ